ncbi:Gamma-interferon-inducible lysosomal thiol reductase [Chionoecetes opilio]|uniref:Gamma-interferon-inducible lysosomal thiol reductase n=1 Tax=Chionoecetes opilio TaxID=41210 RepID=A0A8J4Y8X6_CHIOP|nr:Gamma-interferon-inducible lysosomal thiol reductase [Chionoecetes opilio]
MAVQHLLCLALLPLVLGAPAAITKTKVSVYYESLSPKSQDFFTKQLYPVWLDLKDYIAVDLYVHGRTQVSRRHGGSTGRKATETGVYNFECMHGLGECVGNIMMMCAKHNIPTVEQYMGYSNCIMEKFRGAAESNAVRGNLRKMFVFLSDGKLSEMESLWGVKKL